MTATAPPDRSAAGPRRRPARGRTHELEWRLIRDEPKSGAENMALDHALAASMGPDEAVLRLYAWSRPTVSFGKNEPAGRLAGDEGAVDYVRRPTGGRAVLHDAELTYAVVCPLDAFGGLRDAYIHINRALAGALGTMGASVAVADEVSGGGPLPVDAGPCFQSPTRGEIVASGRKLVGSAQARLEGVLLQHGSILIDRGRAQLGTECVTLSDLLDGATYERVADATAKALRKSFGGSWSEGGYGTRELEAAERLIDERYGNDTWTWRRRREVA